MCSAMELYDLNSAALSFGSSFSGAACSGWGCCSAIVVYRRVRGVEFVLYDSADEIASRLKLVYIATSHVKAVVVHF